MPTCVVSQPRFFPGLHYLHRMMVSDIFVILDTVQFTPRHEENRARVKTPNGPRWITAPMRHVSREQLILETHVDATQAWPKKIAQTIETLYGKTPHYKSHAQEIMDILERPHERLTPLDRASWEPALRLLGITCTFVCASELPVSGRGPRLLLDICKHLGARSYLSGASGRDYIDIEAFAAEGVAVVFHEYAYPVYAQAHGEFVPFLSYLDALFNVGLHREWVLAGAANGYAPRATTSP
jgi:hypothetical protein